MGVKYGKLEKKTKNIFMTLGFVLQNNYKYILNGKAKEWHNIYEIKIKLNISSSGNRKEGMINKFLLLYKLSYTSVIIALCFDINTNIYYSINITHCVVLYKYHNYIIIS